MGTNTQTPGTSTTMTLDSPFTRRRRLLPLPAEQEPQEGKTPTHEGPIWVAPEQETDPDVLTLATFDRLFAGQPEEQKQRLAPYVSGFCIGAGHLRALSQSTDPLPYHFALVRALIQKEEEREATTEEITFLTIELAKRLQQASGLLGMEEVTLPDLRKLKAEDGMLWLDARALRFLRSIGAFGEELARRIAKDCTTKWLAYQIALEQKNDRNIRGALGELWSLLWAKPSPKYTPLGFAWFTAQALWVDFVKPRMGHASTVPIQIFDLVLSNYGTRGGELSSDGKALLRAGEPVFTVPALPPSHVLKLSDAIQALGSLDMARAIPWLVRRGWEQQGQPNATKILINGGLEAFAKDVLKIQSGTGTKRAQSVLDAGQWFHRQWPGGFQVGGLWTYVYAPAFGQKPARLGVTLGDFLLPHAQFGRDLEPWLAPILDPPVLVGRPRDHAAQAFFAMRLVLEMVEHRRELLDGGAILPRETIEQMANSVGLPLSTLYGALEEWSQKGENAFLEIEGDPKKGARYLLADTPAFKPAREFLFKGAALSQKARQKGKASRATKQFSLLGNASKPSKR